MVDEYDENDEEKEKNYQDNCFVVMRARSQYCAQVRKIISVFWRCCCCRARSLFCCCMDICQTILIRYQWGL